MRRRTRYEFDVDGSGQVTYNEMLAVLQPTLAKANPSAAASDPNNREKRWRYNKHDREDAAKLIERGDTVRDVPYAHQRRTDSKTANAHFQGSLRDDGVDANAKWQPKQHAAATIPGMRLEAPTEAGSSVQEQMRDQMTRLATTRIVDVFRA